MTTDPTKYCKDVGRYEDGYEKAATELVRLMTDLGLDKLLLPLFHIVLSGLYGDKYEE